ncbi:MAG TPA: serine/threonine-protein kinase [Terriglobia bacterium]|nr:serine/threonine-protein kinase [Terriglobia bacterium]
MTDERYEIIEEAHGEGGFGRVSKLKDHLLDRLVAVKQLKLLDEEEAKERFRREAKALARMSHPHIPAIYDVRFSDDRMEIHFAFVEGRALRDIINQGAIPSMDQAKRWFTQVAAALEHAHAKGIVHRDVKPDNIIVSADDVNALLVDFGIALTADDVKRLTGTEYVMGTAAYMSPEQSKGEKLDGRSDLYSLAITLYETLSGHLPHAGGYQALSDANEAIPPGIDSLIRDCLAQDRNARLQSAGEFIKRLQSAFRTDVPLSTLLTEARLHEVVAALRQMSAEDFSSKPRGQKLLLVNRLKDLIRIDKPELRTATAQVIALLTGLARFEGSKEFSPIISGAFEWGFEKSYGANWVGQPDIREALVDAAKAANSQAHRVISEAYVEFVGKKNVEELPGWYFHDLRLLVMALLANPACGDKDAENLAVLYDSINVASHV